MPTLREITDILHDWYPPATAESWDAVGLVAGDPEARVEKVMFAIDPTPQVAAEAADWGADLLVVHHPLFLKPVHGFAATTPKGRTLSRLVGAGCALLTAHTNADQAVDGVSQALADRLGITDQRPLDAAPGPALEKIVVFVPRDAAAPLRAAMAEAGAGRIGDYDFASFTTEGEGRFRPLTGADPTIGQVGSIETVDEVRIEAVYPPSRRAEVVRAVLAAHPYETPAYDVQALLDPQIGETGLGRVGTVEPTTLGAFADLVADRLPETAHGVRVAGDPERAVRTVAVLGGAGDSHLDQAFASGADVYLTSDLRHHPALEFLEREGPALVDVAHWAAEWTWLPVVEQRLTGHFTGRGNTVETKVSTSNTDPWTFRV